MLLETFGVVRDLPRLHEIASVLVRYGMGDLMRRLGVISLLERAGKVLHWREASEHQHLDPAERLRLALEELGPTFIKLGQILATRVDVFPPQWISEFEKLQHQVAPLPFEQLVPDLEEAYQDTLANLFRYVNPQPLAAASIAQVHEAELLDGSEVVLKIRRPGVRSKIESDLRIMEHVARLIELEIPESRRYQPVQIVEQFRKSLRRELDFAMEARNIERFAKNFADDPMVKIPRVYWEWTNEIVNVQERIHGVPGTHFREAASQGMDLRQLASNGADVVLKMILLDGFFHADPHPGNVYFLPENRIAMIDFGMVGHLSELRRNQLVNLLAALARRDAEAMLNVLLEWTSEDADVDEHKLASDVTELVYNYENVELKNINIGILFAEVTAVMRDNSLVLPPDMTLLFKALITLEGLGAQLDPNFHMVEHLTPFVRKVLLARYQPDALFKRGKHGAMELVQVLTGLPRDLLRLMREARRGRLKIDLDLKRLEQFGYQLDATANRITMGILTASLVIGSSIVMTVEAGPTIFGMSFFGIMGFLLAFLNSVWIVLSIWRSGKH